MRKMVDGLRGVARPPQGLIEDAGYLGWLSLQDRGWVPDLHRSPLPAHLVLHRARCRHIAGAHGRLQTTQNPTRCGTHRRAFEDWAHREVGRRRRSWGAC